MIVRFGLDDDIYGKIYVRADGTLGYIGNITKLESLVRRSIASLPAAPIGAAENEALLARLLDEFTDKGAGRVWAEHVEPGPNALRHPMTEYLIRTGRLHPDYYDEYFEEGPRPARERAAEPWMGRSPDPGRGAESDPLSAEYFETYFRCDDPAADWPAEFVIITGGSGRRNAPGRRTAGWRPNSVTGGRGCGG